MSDSQLQSDIVHDTLETLNEAKAPIEIRLNDAQILNRFAVSGRANRIQPDTQELKRHIRESMARIVKDPQRQESLLVAIYDAISIRPGFLGISIDLKRIIEHYVPNIRERLSGAQLTQGFGSLRFLVSCGTMTRRVVTLQECRENLGESKLDVLITAGLLKIFQHKQTAYAELSHDMLVPVICQK